VRRLGSDSRSSTSPASKGECRRRAESCHRPNGRNRRLEQAPPVLAWFSLTRYRPPMPDADERLTPAHPRDLADAIAFALRYRGRKRVHQADEYMAAIAAQRIVEYLERAGFVVMQKPPISGTAAIARGFEGTLLLSPCRAACET
jgi:hypothetical protein